MRTGYLIGLVFYKRSGAPIHAIATKNKLYKNDIAPGTEGAILTLANGIKINLEVSKKAKAIAGLQYDHEGFASYVEKNSYFKNKGYNTITTPPGYAYKVLLPDGSKVWLNSSSSIKFPVLFNAQVGIPRRVTMSFRGKRSMYLAGGRVQQMLF